MRTRLLKEGRHLLPLWLGALALMVLPRLIWGAYMTVFAFGLGCMVIAGLSFGSELQHRTLGLLLSQPVPRSVLWREKMLILGVGIALSLGIVLGCLPSGYLTTSLDAHGVVLLALIGLCAFCGAPCLTLLTGSGIGGVVFATVLPGLLAGAAGAAAERWWPQVGGQPTVAGCLVAYCAAAYWLGYRTFRGLEVREGQALDLGLPTRLERALGHRLGQVLPARSGPFLALLRKELRLQQTSFLLAGLFSTMVVLAWVVHYLQDEWAGILITVDCAIYLILLPFTVGALAVAEERALGIAAWHLTLPVSRFKQWSAKLLTALPTSLLLGIVLPAALMVLGGRVLHWPDWRGEYLPLRQGLLLLLLQLLTTSAAIYSASCCSSSLRAILLAFGIMVAGLTLFFGEVQWIQNRGVMSAGPSPIAFFLARHQMALWLPAWWRRPQLAWATSYLGLALLTGLFLALGFTNFHRCVASARRCLAQLIGFYLLVAWLGLQFGWAMVWMWSRSH